MQYETAFIGALVLTTVTEGLVAAILKRWWRRALGLSMSYKILVTVVVLASVLTLPYVWFVLPALMKTRFWYAVISEIAVFVAEALWYRFILKIRPGSAVMLSLIANAVSYAVGLVF